MLKTLNPSLIVYPGHDEITNLEYEIENNSYLVQEFLFFMTIKKCMENIDIVDLLSKNFNGPKVFFNVSVEAKNY